jgi:hypothetical protein
MERLAAYPLPLWTIVMGVALGRLGSQRVTANRSVNDRSPSDKRE